MGLCSQRYCATEWRLTTFIHNTIWKQEWCEISVKELVVSDGSEDKQDRRTNFFYVASRASSHHRAYHRDLPLLLTLSMEIKEHSLALDLGKLRWPLRGKGRIFKTFSFTPLALLRLSFTAGEIIDDSKLSKQDSSLELVLKQIRLVGLYSLDAADDESQQVAARTLKRILRLYEKSAFRRVVDVPGELLKFLEHRAGKRLVDITEPNVLELIQFFAEEAIPEDVLRAMSMDKPPANFQPEIFPVLHTLLSRGASSGSELSASLLRIRRSRQRLGGRLSVPSVDDSPDDDSTSQSIWKNMSTGMVAIGK